MSNVIIKTITPSEAPEFLLLDADPSIERIQRYLSGSQCFAAELNAEIIGVCVLQRIDAATFELMNIAVKDSLQGEGIGSRLLKQGIAWARSQKAHRLLVGTGTFGDQLIFYQKLGFRVTGVWQNHFVDNYPEPIMEEGIQHLDMLRLELNLE